MRDVSRRNNNNNKYGCDADDDDFCVQHSPDSLFREEFLEEKVSFEELRGKETRRKITSFLHFLHFPKMIYSGSRPV